MRADQGRADQGRVAQRLGIDAEAAARDALLRDGWTILAERFRTRAGEIDLVAEKDGLLAIIEVKARAKLSDAAYAVDRRKQMRLLAAGNALLAARPGWGRAGIRFDVMLVDAAGQVRRISDAFRLE